MNTSLHRMVACVLAQILCVGAAFASDKVIEKPVAADTPEKFAEVAEQIKSEMHPDGRYEFINSGERGKVEADLDSIARMLKKSGSVAAMSQTDQVQLFNTQEHLNGILTHSDRNRLVCERRPSIGSNIPINTCRTLGEIEQVRRDTQNYLKFRPQDATISNPAISKSGP